MRRVELGPFVVDRRIGVGGMSEVWAALHADDDVPVAIKVLVGDRALRPHARRQFRAEVRAVARLVHPHIVGVHDVGEVDAAASDASGGALLRGAPYLVMDKLPGGSLWSLRGRLAWPDLRALCFVLLDALGHAHARGVIHRDLKPSNVLLAPDRRPVLCDFGIAWLPERDDDEVLRAGTPSYMAPEQLENRWRDFGPWTDLYGLGCLLWTVAAGAPPFRRSGLEDTRDLHHERPPRLVALQSVPDGFEGWLRALLMADPVARVQRAADARWALQQIDPEDGVGLDRQPLVEPEPVGFREPPRRPAGGPLYTPTLPPVSPDWRGPRAPPRLHLRGAGLTLLRARAVPPIGRSTERDVLWSALLSVIRDRAPRAVILEGAAGTGKTHLAKWFCETVDEVGAATVWWAGHPTDAPGGLANLIRTQLRCEGLDEGGVRERVDAVAAGLSSDDRARLVELAVAGATETGASATAPDRLGALVQYARAVCTQRPLVIVVDEAERGADALSFVRWAVAGPDPIPVVFVIAVRDDAAARSRTVDVLLDEIASDRRTDRVHIEPLGEDEQMTLLREQVALEGEVAHRIVTRTGGNPAYALAVVQECVDRGLLVTAEGGFRLVDGTEEVWLPDDLHASWGQVLAAALDGASPDVWVGLELAAIMGMRVATAEWTQVGAGIHGVDTRIEPLEPLFSRRLLIGARPDESLRFAHPVVREVLMRRAAEAGRAVALHEAVLAHLRTRSVVDERRLARHLVAARRPDAALHLLVGAARRATLTGNLHGALEFCDQADAVEAGNREVLLERARALLWLGRLAEAEAAALGLAGDRAALVQERCEARLVIAGVTVRRGHPADVLALSSEIVATARDAGAMDTVARALALRARAALAADLAEEALTSATEARRHAAEVGDRLTWAEACALLARALFVLEHPREAVKILNDGLTVEHAVPRAELLCLLGDLLRRHGGEDGRGDPVAAHTSYAEAAEALERTGSLEVVVARERMALLALTEENHAEAWRLGERCRREALREGRPPLELDVHVILMCAAIGLGDRAGAAEHSGRIKSLLADGVAMATETRALYASVSAGAAEREASAGPFEHDPLKDEDGRAAGEPDRTPQETTAGSEGSA